MKKIKSDDDGETSFNVSIIPPFGDAKQLTIQNLKAKGLEINTNGSQMIAPSGTEEICTVQEIADDHYSIRFTLKENGIHWIHVRFNGRDRPESSCRVFVGQTTADPGRVSASGIDLHQGETG